MLVVLQAGAGRRARQAFGGVVPALRAGPRRMHHLRNATGRVPQLVLQLDRGFQAGAGVVSVDEQDDSVLRKLRKPTVRARRAEPTSGGANLITTSSNNGRARLSRPDSKSSSTSKSG